MQIVMFYHSLVSDWNHGNAHFLRGIAWELKRRGHEVRVFEPRNGWSRKQLLAVAGPSAIEGFHRAYPGLDAHEYDESDLDLDRELDKADLVIVHEWSSHALVERIGRHRRDGGRYVLLFHDTHHRSATQPEQMAGYRLEDYDGVLAFGEVLAEAYTRAGWGRRVFTWHEAADVTTFYPRSGHVGDEVVWVGNWGDGERAQELADYLLEPVRRLGARLVVHGVRYPDAALAAVARAGGDYRGWIPGPRVAEVLSQSRFTVHVPRRWYREQLVGIPTIRMFEALACGVPLIAAPWQDTEGLFRTGTDYLLAGNPAAMQAHMALLLRDADARWELSRNGLQRILERHTCGHRVNELLEILVSMGMPERPGQVSL